MASVLLLDRAEERIDLRERVHFIAEQLDTICVVIIRGKNFDYIATNTKGPALKVTIVAFIENLHQFAENVLALDLLPFFQEEQHAVISLRRSQAVDAAYRSDNNAVAPLKERPRGGEPELVQLVIDGGFFFYINVAGRDVGLGLIVVIIRNEILNCIVRKELLKFMIELRSQSFVVRQDQRRAIELLNHLSHSVGLARTSYSEQHLVLLAGINAMGELVYGACLVAFRLVVAGNTKIHLFPWSPRRREGAEKIPSDTSLVAILRRGNLSSVTWKSTAVQCAYLSARWAYWRKRHFEERIASRYGPVHGFSDPYLMSAQDRPDI